jgi:hypothetical protein
MAYVFSLLLARVEEEKDEENPEAAGGDGE